MLLSTMAASLEAVSHAQGRPALGQPKSHRSGSSSEGAARPLVAAGGKSAADYVFFVDERRKAVINLKGSLPDVFALGE